VAPRVFGRLGAQVHAICAEPDGDNINRAAARPCPRAAAGVRSHGASVGIALDGDGDRCILVDESGEIVNGDGMLTLCARTCSSARRAARPAHRRHRHEQPRPAPRAARRGHRVVTVDVGDRRVVEGLRREKLKLGGEQSGHIVFGADHFYIGDGLYTALRVLRAMRDSKKPLSELAAPTGLPAGAPERREYAASRP
jgi:phosphoglucosamine mutase